MATLTDHIFTPSSRFRVRQYFPYLEANGISLHDYDRSYSTETVAVPNGNRRIRHSVPLIAKAVLYESMNILGKLRDVINSNKFDAVWLSRQLIVGYPSFELLIRKPLVYDVDDAIFLTGKGAKVQFKMSAERASVVIAGNNFLAEEASKYSRNVQVIPTAVDTRRWVPAYFENENDQNRANVFRVGWSGTSSFFHSLIPVQHEIKKFLQDFPSAKFAIMADRFPIELDELKGDIEFVKWSPIVEVDFMQSLDVGLMPMLDNSWSRGKCAYKILLYAACGIPVIATPIGFNSEVLAQADVGLGPRKRGEWYKSLCHLFDDFKVRKSLGSNGVALVRKEYSVEVLAPKIENILRRSL